MGADAPTLPFVALSCLADTPNSWRCMLWATTSCWEKVDDAAGETIRQNRDFAWFGLSSAVALSRLAKRQCQTLSIATPDDQKW